MTQQPDTPWWTNGVMYWFENQITVTFHSHLPLSPDHAQSAGDIIASLHLKEFNQFLQERGFELTPFRPQDMPRDLHTEHEAAHNHDINDPLGKYCFRSPSDQGTIVVAFFEIKRAQMPHPIQDMRVVHQLGGTQDTDESCARQLSKLINHNLDRLRQDGHVPIVAAMPNWLGGATGCITHGCSAAPFPVLEEELCSSSAGWTFTLPELSSTLEASTGKGVTIFVLDTMPTFERVQQAAQQAGKRNWLLKEVATQMEEEGGFIRATYQRMPRLLDENAKDPLKTGRDIYGRPSGFSMPDHGLFVVGVLRDLAPEAKIEYSRTLNDCGVCDIQTLIHELAKIHERMAAGDLRGQAVVINLSLVVLPPHDELPHFWFNGDSCTHADEFMEMMEEIEVMHAPLHLVIQSLTALGAVIVASAGNDSNTPDMPGRMVPRYPAAFPEVISVGAVDSDGEAVPYSDYPVQPPDHNGIATYGGVLPTPTPSSPLPNGHVEIARPVDAPRGIYSSKEYPALSGDNPNPEYKVPNDSAWAYWPGTSFSTPIISAVAARLLAVHMQNLPPHLRPIQVQWAITTAKGQQELLTRNGPLYMQSTYGVSMLQARQECKK